jgi:hypothetical protein
LFAFCVDRHLILLFGWTWALAVRILVDALEEVVVFGLVDDLASVCETDAEMGTNLVDNGCREMVSDAMDVSRKFMAFGMGGDLAS